MQGSIGASHEATFNDNHRMCFIEYRHQYVTEALHT